MSKVFSLGGGSGGGGIKLVSIAITEPPEKVNYRPGQSPGIPTRRRAPWRRAWRA